MTIDYEILKQAHEAILKRFPKAAPRRGLILGSGWGDVVEAFNAEGAMDYTDIPGLGATGVQGHTGRLVWGQRSGLETFIFQGRRHWYEGVGWTPVALPIYVLKQMGVEVLVLTNAAGGIRDGFKSGDLMAIDDHINFMSVNPLIGPHNPVWGPRFPDQSEAYNKKLRAMLDRSAVAQKVLLHHGVYLAASGPSYETPAEIRSYRTLGADAVGMSTVPETILANAAGLRVAAISCITNLAAGISPTPLTHEEVVESTQAAMGAMKNLLMQFWKEMSLEER